VSPFARIARLSPDEQETRSARMAGSRSVVLAPESARGVWLGRFGFLSAPKPSVLEVSVRGQLQVVDRFANGNAVCPAGDVPLAGDVVVACEEPRVGGQRETVGLAGIELDPFEAEQTRSWLAGGVGQVQLQDVGAAACPVFVTVMLAVIVSPPLSEHDRHVRAPCHRTKAVRRGLAAEIGFAVASSQRR